MKKSTNSEGNCNSDRHAGTLLKSRALLIPKNVRVRFWKPFGLDNRFFTGPTFQQIFHDLALNFGKSLRSKLYSINQPQLSLAKPERKASVDVHEEEFKSTLARRFRFREVGLLWKHYRVTTLDRLNQILGSASFLVRRNHCGDYSILNPLAALNETVNVRVGDSLKEVCQGAIVAPIAIQDGSVLAFFPDRDGPIQPIGGGRVLLYHAPRDIGRSWTRKGRKFLTLNCRPESANSDVAAGDLLQIRGDTYEVTKVEEMREESFSWTLTGL